MNKSTQDDLDFAMGNDLKTNKERIDFIIQIIMQMDEYELTKTVAYIRGLMF